MNRLENVNPETLRDLSQQLSLARRYVTADCPPHLNRFDVGHE